MALTQAVQPLEQKLQGLKTGGGQQIDKADILKLETQVRALESSPAASRVAQASVATPSASMPAPVGRGLHLRRLARSKR